jgi:GNAT superfamily N-acetyltransferase
MGYVRAAGGTVRFSRSRRIAPAAVKRLFVANGMNDWLTLADVRRYLADAAFVASAWTDGSCVGVAALVGMPKLSVELDILLVDAGLRGKGIGTRLLGMVLDAVRRLRPYSFGVQVFEKRTERFYRRHGFVLNRGTWLLEHAATGERLRARAHEVRSRRGSCRQWRA